MRTLLIACLLALGLAAPAMAQNADIEATIGAQMEAFRTGDVDRAFTYASPTIRDLFQTPENFGAMVRNGYPMVWRPSEVQYLDLREIDGALWQAVQVTDTQGRVHYLGYQMIQTENGWKINAVKRIDAPDASV